MLIRLFRFCNHDAVVCFLLILSVRCAEQSVTSKPPTTTGICPLVSINYITHGLPQQCFTTSRSASSPALSQPPPELSGSPISTATSSDVLPITIRDETSLDSTYTTTAAPAETSLTSSALASESVITTLNTTLSNVTLPTATSTSTSNAAQDPDADADSPLDNAKFLSFDDWRKQNLEQVGQSADNIGHGRGTAGSGSARDRSRPGANSGLDALGDDTEIELDFTGFGSGAQPSDGRSNGARDGAPKSATSDSSSGVPTARSKDAGRTCKERFNYASFDCAANVLKTNPRARSTSSILVENKDSYMLNECSVDNKFIIVELCDDILIDTIVLANFEFFSSMFRTFKISVSDRYPIKLERWKELGTFEARNSREIQAFLIENPLIWARYLRVEFLTQYGSEYYCPVSLLRVHGTTMMDEFRHQEQLARGEIDDEDDEEIEVETVQPKKEVVGSAVAISTPDHKEVKVKPTSIDKAIKVEHQAVEPTSAVSLSPVAASKKMGEQASATSLVLSCSTKSHLPDQPSLASITTTSPDISTSVIVLPSEKITLDMSSSATDSPSSTQTSTSSTISPPTRSNTSSAQDLSTKSSSTSNPIKESVKSVEVPIVASATNKTVTPTTVVPSAVREHTTSTTPSSTPPATQESFFKSIQKRLQSLEANATLSLQYIEAQSQLLREAFSKVEKRQVMKTTAFLDSLNTTVSAELARFRAEYEQAWLSTMLELAAQREEGKRDSEVLGERVKMLAEEMVGQKRVIAAQATALLICAGLILLTKLGSGVQAPGVMQGVQDVVGGGRREKGGIVPDVAVSKRTGKRRRWNWESPWGRRPPPGGLKQVEHGTMTPRSEEEDERLRRGMQRLTVGGGVESPSPSSPGVEVSGLSEADEVDSEVGEGVNGRISGVESAPVSPGLETPELREGDGVVVVEE